MTAKLCKYGCGTMLEGFDEEARKFLETGTGGLHTKERCQEAKAKLATKDDHGNEMFSPEAGEKLAERIVSKHQDYVDHTQQAKGQSKVKIFFSKGVPMVEEQYNKFLEENNGKIKTQGAQFQIGTEEQWFAIALYYEEVK